MGPTKTFFVGPIHVPPRISARGDAAGKRLTSNDTLLEADWYKQFHRVGEVLGDTHYTSEPILEE